MKRIFVLVLSAVLLCLMFSACSDNNQDKKPTDSSLADDSIVTSDTASETEAPKKIGVNFLTGEATDESATKTRPVAVMVNNIVTSLPQYGISSADIIYEMPVEGGITRMMAVYSDYTKVPKVCSIRSCRYYYPLIALGMDAVYVHWGMDNTIAKNTLLSTGIDRLDGGTKGSEYFGRDSSRLKNFDLEHTGYFDGPRLSDAMKKYNYRTKVSDKFNNTLFTFNDTAVAPAGVKCDNAVVKFSNGYYSTFTYNSSTRQYTKQHSGKPHMDAVTGKQLSFTNVFVLQTKVVKKSNSVLMDIELKGGTGKYISNGVCENITWSKANDSAPIVLKKADGTELSINQGKSYIAFIGAEKTISIS